MDDYGRRGSRGRWLSRLGAFTEVAVATYMLVYATAWAPWPALQDIGLDIIRPEGFVGCGREASGWAQLAVPALVLLVELGVCVRVWRSGTRPVRWLAVGAGVLLAGYVAWSFIREDGNCLTVELFVREAPLG